MTMNQLSYKVVSEQSMFVFPDTTAKHAQYDEQVIQTFYVSHADPTELTQILSAIVRFTGIAIQPLMQPNKTSNTIVVRGSRPVVEIIGKSSRRTTSRGPRSSSTSRSWRSTGRGPSSTGSTSRSTRSGRFSRRR